MTSSTPVSPLYPINDTNPPPRKRQRDEGKEMNEELSNDEEETQYSPAGGSGDEREEAMDTEFEELFVNDKPIDESNQKPEEVSFECPPCSGARIPWMLNSPIKPSAEAIAQHYTNHLPYRNWCPVCVKAKGVEAPHRRGANAADEEDKGGVPVVGIDYNALDEEMQQVDESAAKLKTMVMKDETTGNVYQHKIEVKGAGDEWLSKKMCRDLEELGRRDMILKSDGEPAIVAIQSKVQSMRPGRTIPRNPPAYNPESNGAIEKAVRDVTGQSRALKIGLEARLKATIPEVSAIMEWILEHAPFLINKFSVGHDGMTPHERLTGSKWRRPIVEIGEVVLAKLVGKKRKKGKKDKQRKKLAEQSIEAIYVGQVARTGEHIVAQSNGDAFRCRTVRRVPLEDRWNLEKVLNVIATPRKPAPTKVRSESLEPRLADEGVGVIPRRPREPRASGADHPSSGAALEQPESRPVDLRDFRITDKVLEDFGGYHAGCPGCMHKADGLAGHRGHNRECRLRLQENMEKTDEGRAILDEARRRLAAKSGAAPAPPVQPEVARGSGQPQVEEPREPEVKESAEPAAEDAIGGMATPRFGPENECEEDDEDDMDELMELNEDNVGADRSDAKRNLEKDSNETDDEPNAKKQKLKKVGIARMVITVENEYGKVIGVSESAEDRPRSDSRGGLVPLFNHRRPRTSIARAMSDPGASAEAGKNPEIIVEKQCDELIQCLKLLSALRQHTEVKRIMKDLDETFKGPGTTTRAKSMNANGKHDIAEVYSPPRMTEMARQMNLRPGWALDLTEIDEDDGLPWDLSTEQKRRKAKEKVDRDKPFMLILCPMCGPFSSAQNFNYINMSEQDVKDKMAKAMEHIKFAVELCVMQINAGRLFMFEHPAGASTWESKLLRDLYSRDGVFKVNFDFCMAGMKVGNKVNDAKKLHPVKKRTGLMTNSHAIYTIFREVQCRGEHVHADISGGKTSECQRYPEKFCKMVCEGVKRELQTVKWRNRLCEVFDVTQSFGKLLNVHEKIDKMECPPEEDPFSQLYEGLEFVDDISGSPLIKELAIEARKLEIDFFKRMGVYTKVARQSWMRVISTKWIDQNKGDSANPNYRARLVGREIKKDQRQDLFAATPPLESLKLVMSICASHQGAMRDEDNFVVMYNDVKRAYFYAPAKRPVYIKIPDEDFEPGDENRVGVLNLSLYGTRDAAMNWADKYTEVLRNAGFAVGAASPCNFFHEQRNISATVHGDDFTSTGTAANLKWLEVRLKEAFEMTMEVFGPQAHQCQQVRILNRVMTWTPEGIQYEADQRHAEIIIGELGLEGAKALTTPGSREEAGRAGPPSTKDSSKSILKYNRIAKHYINVVERYKDPEDDNDAEWPERCEVEDHELLSAPDAKAFRGLAARLNYLSQDRPDLQYAAKEISRRMARPSQRDWQLLKRVGRYLVGAPRAVQSFCWQSSPGAYDTFVDSDWAGCATTCRSTSGGAVRLGWHTIKTWSTTQATVAMSSAEAELFSLTKGTSVTLGLISVAKDLGLNLDATVHSDASAALAIAQRQGLGKLRHLKVQYLWVQERVRHGDLGVRKVNGKDNPADLLTKHLAQADMEKHVAALGIETSATRADLAPELSSKEMQNSESAGQWEFGENGAVTMHHLKPRRHLFTPLRVQGSPPAKMLTAMRETRGTYCDNGEKFLRRDHWTSRATAHEALSRPWIGTSTFLLRTGNDDLN